MHDERLIDLLLSLPETVGERPVMIITDEMSLLTISQRRDEIASYFRIALPSHKTLLLLQDKVRFHEFAVETGLPIPRGVVLRRVDECEYLRDLRFPIVLKPADKCDVHLHRVPRLVVARNMHEAIAACRRLLDRVTLIAQEWVEGPDSNIYFCLFYRGDRQIVMFSGQKLASSPPGTGNTAICIGADHLRDVLETATRQFLDTVPDYRGFGSVEYKWDESTGSMIIIEPTVGRTDWQEEIATLLGVNLPLVGYLLGCGSSLQPFVPTGNVAWQASFVQRWKTASPPKEVEIVDGFWRRDDPMPAIVHYPFELLREFPLIMSAIAKRSARRAKSYIPGTSRAVSALERR